MTESHAIIPAMIAHWNAHLRMPLEDRVFASLPSANVLVKENLVAFLIAAAIDRGGQAFELWNLPYKLQQSWRHLDTKIIQRMDPAELKEEDAIARAPSQIARSVLRGQSYWSRPLSKTVTEVSLNELLTAPWIKSSRDSRRSSALPRALHE